MSNNSRNSECRHMRTGFLRAALIVAIALMAWPLAAQQDATGPVTNLPLPRFISLKATEANVRRGPSQSQRIDWILMHKGTPLQVTAEFEHWRRVQDHEGAGGWIHYTLLSGVRTVVVTTERVAMHETPDGESHTLALADRNVIGRLGNCTVDWCQIETGGFEGWVRKTDIWGVGAGEIRN